MAPRQKKRDKLLNLGLARLLDANLNRAREGLRVVEDTARFIWDDTKLYHRIRSLRHQVFHATATSYKALVLARDSQVDPGRAIREKKRKSLIDVVGANIHRAQEAVRVLEEYEKVFSNHEPRKMKAIRYQLYNVEKDCFKKYG